MVQYSSIAVRQFPEEVDEILLPSSQEKPGLNSCGTARLLCYKITPASSLNAKEIIYSPRSGSNLYCCTRVWYCACITARVPWFTTASLLTIASSQVQYSTANRVFSVTRMPVQINPCPTLVVCVLASP